MAETDELNEFGREPGFSCLVYSPDSSHMLHLHMIKLLNYYWARVNNIHNNILSDTLQSDTFSRMFSHC